MPPFETPTIVVTRPRSASDEFAAALTKVAGAFDAVICPAFELIPTKADVPVFGAAIFTSRAGVSFAPDGKGRTAYCVGDATAASAALRGYTPISAGGSVSDVCELILGAAPPEKLLHIRGESSAGDVTAALRAANLMCADAVVYRKDIMPVERQVLSRLDNSHHVIFPLFSPETVSILGNWEYNFSRSHMVAMSDSVADVAAGLSPASITVSDRPNLPSMVAATARLIA